MRLGPTGAGGHGKETQMAGKRFNDINVGDKFLTPGKTVTDTHVTTFVGLGGYLAPFFLDEEYAKGTVFGGRVVPGRVTVLLMGGLVEQAEIFDLDGLIAMLGLDKVRVQAPLRIGDTIKVEVEITEKRLTSKGDRGIIVHAERCFNQRGEMVAELEGTHLLKLG